MSRSLPFLAMCFVVCHCNALAANERLEGQPRKIFLVTDRPKDVSELGYDAMVTQAQIRLRRSGFLVQSGTTTAWEDQLREGRRPHFARVMISVNTLKLETNEFVFTVSVSLKNTAYAVVETSDLEIQVVGSERKLKANPIIPKVYETQGVFGIAREWKSIEEASLRQVDQFINDYLTANPR